jgi:Amt family ammonium transporter
VITVGLITGSSADRLKFGGFVVFALVWSILVYAPVAHWVFSPTGWLAKRGVEDFAGGTVVHINAAMAALALAVVAGRRKGWPQRKMEPHNIPFILLGGGILWFGWFGFNAGSALGANNLSAHAFVNTNTAAAVALLAWIAVEKLRGGKSTTVGAVCGAVAGLVAITPACGFVNLLGATVIGLVAGVVCCLAVRVKFKMKVDDSLDVLAVHFVGSSLGMLFVGLFGTAAIGGVNGLFYGGGAGLFGRELLAVVVVALYSLVVSALIALAVKKTIGLRLGDEAEELGLDISQHGESAYSLDPVQP